ncbi:hypothetical protein BBJ28_00006731 [Nothophytophthora sp. Chile5]|nr:hypothetical protein BBJ28_00006731 [Nothophytophthora sp. Chile5]
MGCSQLSDAIDEMSLHVSTSSVKTQDAMLQRYRELYFDFKTEFRRSMRDSQKLFGNSSIIEYVLPSCCFYGAGTNCPHYHSLALSAGYRQAMATKGALENQRAQFTSSHGKVSTLGNSFAGINTLVEQIRRKKMRNNSILALVIAGCLCFTLWWVVLSKI